MGIATHTSGIKVSRSVSRKGLDTQNSCNWLLSFFIFCDRCGCQGVKSNMDPKEFIEYCGGDYEIGGIECFLGEVEISIVEFTFVLWQIIGGVEAKSHFET